MAEQSIIQRFTNLFRRRGVPADVEDPPASTATSRDFWIDWLESFGVDPSRTSAYAEFELMDLESPVVAAALDAITDAAVAGADGEAEETYTVVFPDDRKAMATALDAEVPLPTPPEKPDSEEVDPEILPGHPGSRFIPEDFAPAGFGPDEAGMADQEKAAEIFEELEERTQIKRAAWQQIRGFLLMGDEVNEVVIDAREKVVARLKGLPPQSIIVVPDRLGEVRKEYSYRQHDETGRLVAVFEPWQIVHYADKVRTFHTYGRSHLASLRRIYKQLAFLSDSMVVNRLTRSTMRYVHKIPTGNLSPDQAAAYIERYKKQFLKRRTFDSTGKLNVQRQIFGDEVDFFVPLGKEAQGGVEALQGQNGFDKIEDVKFFQSQLFAGLRVPPAYLGFSDEAGDRSIVTGLDVAFGRVVRRAQQTHGIGNRQVYQTELALRGMDPEKVRFRFKYPALGTVDEMREWQVKLLRAQVAQVLKTSNLISDDEYLLRTILEVEAEDMAKIVKANQKAAEQKAAEMKAQLDARSGFGGRFGRPVPGDPTKPGGPPKPQGMAQRKVDDAKEVRPRRMPTNERLRRKPVPRSLENAVRGLIAQPATRKLLQEVRCWSRPQYVESGSGAMSAAVRRLQEAGGCRS